MAKSVFFLLVIFLYIIPPVLFLISFRVKRSGVRIGFYFFGAVGIIMMLHTYISSLIEIIVIKFLNMFGIHATFTDSSPLDFLIIASLLFLAYRMLPVLMQLRYRKFLNHARSFICKMQNPKLPDCDDLIVRKILDGLLSTQKPISKDFHRDAETVTYRIALSLVDSPRFRDLFGDPNDTCKQLLYICHNAQKYFYDKGYITKEEFEDHQGFIASCYLESENYGIY